ncbi:MAG: hypothetical protein Q4E10_04485 [Porphyromonas sp.]|nr:hypothetical protein [Porphyromonas sp.]
MMMNFKRHIVLCCGIALAGLPVVAKAGVYDVDSLTREMVLQRDYQPVGHQAEKAFFNPLDNTRTKQLRPISFARNTYPIAMNVQPKLFAPIDNPLAPEAVKQSVHARLFGGYPGIGGANIGVLAKPSESGVLMISADHLSRYVKPTYDGIGFKPMDRTHDTDVTLAYDHALDDRVIKGAVEVFHNANTFYGLYPVNSDNRPSEASYPLHNMVGTEVHLGISPAPLSIARGWQYSMRGKVGYLNKDNVSHFYDNNLLVSEESVRPNDKNKISELSLDLWGNLGYKLAGSDWGFGADGNYQLINVTGINGFTGRKTPMQMLSAAPYFDYTSPDFILRAGVKVQVLNSGSNKYIVVPDIRLRYKMHDYLSVYFDANGGAKYHTVRQLYNENRWIDAISVHKGYDVEQFEVQLGAQIGNINGFSLDINGGYAQYSDLSDWGFTTLDSQLPVSSADGTVGGKQSLYTPVYTLMSRGKARHIFVNVTSHYISPIGLDLSAGLQINSYKGLDDARDFAAYGLPKVELDLSADYQLDDRWSFNVNLMTLMGIKFGGYDIDGKAVALNANEGADSKNYVDLGVRASYKIHENVGLSFVGQNLLNQKQGRWLGYNREGITGMLALTLKF